tara:strand:- start:1126 stop:1527 length:402 start_codon:yes stop_codon:yes gene_type:complete
MSKEFKYETKVYYEDTDAGGVVYYANYLKFLERARTEMISSFDLNNRKLLKDYKALIIVKSINIEYKKPARLEDKLQIYSSIKSITKASFIMCQKIKKNEEKVLDADIHLVTINPEGKPIKIPQVLEENLKIN